MRRKYVEVARLNLSEQESVARFPLFVEVREALKHCTARVIGSPAWMQANTEERRPSPEPISRKRSRTPAETHRHHKKRHKKSSKEATSRVAPLTEGDALRMAFELQRYSMRLVKSATDHNNGLITRLVKLSKREKPINT